MGLGHSCRHATWRVSDEWEKPLLKGVGSEARSPTEASYGHDGSSRSLKLAFIAGRCPCLLVRLHLEGEKIR